MSAETQTELPSSAPGTSLRAAQSAWGAVVIALALVVFIAAPLPLADKFYWIGFGICPQRAGHSFFLGAAQLPAETALRAALPVLNTFAPAQPTKMPVEARMYGMFAGFLVTWLYAFLSGRGRTAVMPGPTILFTYVCFIAIMGWDGINATLYDLHREGLPVPFLYAPRLELRFLTGWLCGIAMAGIILPVVNFCLWQKAQARPLFDRWLELTPLLLLGVTLLIVQLTGSGLFFYPLAVLAPVGILAILSSLNVVLYLTLGKRERVAANWWEALNPLGVALCLSLIELAFLSLVRFAAFGLGEIS